jgi:hypothetical protein
MIWADGRDVGYVAIHLRVVCVNDNGQRPHAAGMGDANIAASHT